MNLLRSFSYSRVDKEDPDEKKHRRAQFLIYKVLEEARCRKRRSPTTVAMLKFKVEVGSQLKRMRKTVLSSSISITMAKARACVHEKVMKQVRTWKLGVGVLWSKGDVMDFTPLFA